MSAAAPTTPNPSPPPTLRDPWAWVTAAAMLPLVLLTSGTPRGQAVAEDFDFLRRALFDAGSWFDGGGSAAYWRPLANQAYFRMFGELLLEHPGRIATLHFLLLGAAALLVFRALRPAWPGSHAAVAAAFPLFAAASRSLVCWASNIADLGAMFFLALAIHERTRRRLWTGLAAAAAALLFKEFALAGLLLLPFVPDARPGATRERRRWLAGAGVTAVVWASAYAAVRASAHLQMPHGLETDPRFLRVPVVTRVFWAIANGIGATFSTSGRLAATLAPAAVAIAVAAGFLVLARRARHGRAAAPGRSTAGWIAWGAAYALGCWLSLAPIFPLWSPYRSVPGSVGFGIAAVGIAGAVDPLLPAGLAITRLALLVAAPRPARRIEPELHDDRTFFDYGKLVRLQRLARATQEALAARYPTLPKGALLAWYDLPLSTEYAFHGALAWQLWYRDTTLGVTTVPAFAADPSLPVVAILSYQPRHDPQVVLLDTAAVRAKLDGVAHLEAGAWARAIECFDHADSLQTDPAARVFLGDVAGRRAYCFAQLGRWDEAERHAQRALAAAPEDVGARYVVAAALAMRHENRAALAHLDTLLAIRPDDAEARATRSQILALIPNATPPRQPGAAAASTR